MWCVSIFAEDALRVQDALRKRLGSFGLTLEPTKTKLVEFGRFAQRHAGKRGRGNTGNHLLPGFTLYCTRNRNGNFKVGMRTEKSRLRRSLMSMQEKMRQMRHPPPPTQTSSLILTRPLRLRWRWWNHPRTAEEVSARRVLLAEDAMQPQLGGPALHLADFNRLKERVPLTYTKAATAYWLEFGDLAAL